MQNGIWRVGIRFQGDMRGFSPAFCSVFRDESGSTGHKVKICTYLDGLPQFTTNESCCCDQLITSAEIKDVIAGHMRSRLPGIDVLPYELCTCMPEMFGNWQRNARFSGAVTRTVGVITPLRLNSDKVGNMFNSELEIWALS